MEPGVATNDRAPPQATIQMKSTPGPAVTLGDAADVERQISLGLELSLQTSNLAGNLPIWVLSGKWLSSLFQGTRRASIGARGSSVLSAANGRPTW
jgi:hypothetical protein